MTGLPVEKAFVEQAVQDAKTSDALPLLAFALSQLYEKNTSGNHALTLDGWNALGDPAARLTPIENSVRRAADRVLAELKPGDDELAALRNAFVAHMVRVNVEGEYVRRAALWSVLPPQSHTLLERLARARLLIVGGEPKTVEVAHEALLRNWPRLREWLDEAREFLVWRERLSQAHADYKAEQRGLLAGKELDIARGWMQSEHEIAPADQEFIRGKHRRGRQAEAREGKRGKGSAGAAGPRRRADRGGAEASHRSFARGPDYAIAVPGRSGPPAPSGRSRDSHAACARGSARCRSRKRLGPMSPRRSCSSTARGAIFA